MNTAPDEAELRLIHAAIPGRARFHLARLKGNGQLGQQLLADLPGRMIEHVSANPITGNILIFFDPDVPLDRIERLLRQSLRESTKAPSPKVGIAANRAEAWHALPVTNVLARLDTTEAGLSGTEGLRRLARHGPNRLGELHGRSAEEILLGQFRSLPVALLGASALLSLATGGLADAIVIAGVIGLNAEIGYVSESRAERTITALTKGSPQFATVIRDGSGREIPLDDIVPGDILELAAGTLVPADARLIATDGLSIGEALLTGESLPIEKSADRLLPPDCPLAERTNMVFRGTLVTGGAGRAVVVATGRMSEIGRIQSMIGAVEPQQTPLQHQLARLGRELVGISLAACGAVFALGMVRGHGMLPMLRVAVSLAVAAVPEGLPTLATTTLALGIDSLRRKGILIRALPAVEGLSTIQIICFDKTGTLTLNRMEVARIITPQGDFRMTGPHVLRMEGDVGTAIDPGEQQDLVQLLELCALCNDAELNEGGTEQEVTGSSTETALLQAALRSGLDVAALRARRPRLSASQRSENRRYMTTRHGLETGATLRAVKGNPEDVLALCRWTLADSERRPLDAAERRRIEAENQALGQAAMRVLGVASALDEGELAWAGMVAMMDPVRSDAARVMTRFHEAGIGTVIVTGDQAATAAAIADELGLSNGITPQGALARNGIATLPPNGPGMIADHVFSRVTPAQKLQIIETLRRAGLVVAMVGDGINDAPSLRAADIGIALGGGTDAARQTADVILLTDELEGLVTAIENGRATYDNIRRAIAYLLATNLSEIMLMLVSVASGIGQPLTPVQLLWLNLVTDVLPAIGLALEPPAAGLMQRPPRDAQEPIVSRADYGTLGRDAAIITGTALAGGLSATLRHGAGVRSGAVGFASLIAAQLLYALPYRAARPAGQKSENGRDYLPGALMLSGTAAAAALFLPGLRRLCGGPIDLIDSGIALAAGGAAMALGSGGGEKLR
ncbi:cation-translocating P-type ATPase [Sphingomonas oleivorans]|nr:HAD-IC family P-type ATPase [Sphingomonas oleivorans]